MKLSKKTIQAIDSAVTGYSKKHNQPSPIGLAIASKKLHRLAKKLGFTAEELLTYSREHTRRTYGYWGENY